MNKLGAAIIGCGWVAEEYVKAFQKDQRSEVRALVSRNPANAERYRDCYNLQCAVETDAATMLERKDVDIVAVCTPHNAHTQYVVAAAEARKHIIIEKPVALTQEDVYKQRQAVRKNKVKTIVSFVLHWNPLLITIDHLIEQGVFGDIFMVEVDYLHRIWALKWYGSLQQSGTALMRIKEDLLSRTCLFQKGRLIQPPLITRKGRIYEHPLAIINEYRRIQGRGITALTNSLYTKVL